MPQWQFKLFEYDIKDEYTKSSTDEYVPGKDNKKFVVQMYGIKNKGYVGYIRNFFDDPFPMKGWRALFFFIVDNLFF